jgi:hypothetical protein
MKRRSLEETLSKSAQPVERTDTPRRGLEKMQPET